MAGPLFAAFVARRVQAEPGAMADQFAGTRTARRAPSLAITLLTILMPVLLMLAAALAQDRAAAGARARRRSSWRAAR